MQNKIESSLDLAYDTDASNVIITGDFNYNYLNTAGQRKATSLFEPYGLVQLIDEPTHYTESSESIIDLMLTRNASSLLLFGVGDAFLDQNIDTTAQYMQFLTLTSINTFVIKEIFGNMIMEITIFLNNMLTNLIDSA